MKKGIAKKTTKKEEDIRPISDKAAKAICRYLRISPRKVRLVIDTIRRKPTHVALHRLMMINQKAARMTEKVLKSAVANAKGIGLDEGRLYVADIRADGGPTMKRFRPRSMGRADRILKRMTHLSVVVKEGHKKWRESESDSAKEAGAGKSGKAKSTKKNNKKKAAGAAA